MCRNTSGAPSAGETNPKPFSGLNHLIRPRSSVPPCWSFIVFALFPVDPQAPSSLAISYCDRRMMSAIDEHGRRTVEKQGSVDEGKWNPGASNNAGRAILALHPVIDTGSHLYKLLFSRAKRTSPSRVEAPPLGRVLI